MDKAKVTIYDVADKAGVAISTVSRVLNGSPEVSPDTRRRVQAAIEALEFRPDRTAKSLAQRQTDSIAVAIPSSTSQFYNELLKGVKDCLREHDIDLLLCNLGSGAPLQTLWRFLTRGAVDALMLASLPVDDRLSHELRMLHAPVILIGAESPNFDCFHWDDEAGAHAAVIHLIQNGHRRIGLVTANVWDSKLADTRANTLRVAGYRRALEESGIGFDADLVQSGRTLKHAGFSEEAGYEAMQKLLAIDPSISAVFASSDVQAIGAWKALREAGSSVGSDFAIVGYDDIKISRYIGLSSVDQEMQQIGYRASELLLRRVAEGNQANPISEHIIPQLNVRESSDFKWKP
ncbi:MAG TPA: LacI family DNA-binding transcriptional regulator [Rhodothermales bacterium]